MWHKTRSSHLPAHHICSGGNRQGDVASELNLMPSSFLLGVMGRMVSLQSCVHVLTHRTRNMTLFEKKKKCLCRCNDVEDLEMRSSGLSRGRWVSNPITNVFRDIRGGDTKEAM